ncbi:MAG: DNA cytosine methyltransferase [Candidatus Omnitrophica bacterium]|nr:DNA cytosine methyltransferase [Candidatus Omnitrophota bacterium]
MRSKDMVAIDLFCGAGGLTRGLLDVGIKVLGGYDIDEACRYPYEHNNRPAAFMLQNVAEIQGEKLKTTYPKDAWRILVGCAPCQPFSRYTQGSDTATDEKWGLLSHFRRLVEETLPHVVSMENVTNLMKHGIYNEFVDGLRILGYKVKAFEVYCPDYGIPQHRTRLVLFASLLGDVEIISSRTNTHKKAVVKRVIGELPKLKAGGICPSDPLHRSSSLTATNLKRIRNSKPGGSWRDWPKDLVARCHRKKKGMSYPSVYGRMKWNAPSPTITTQFFGFGNGRFGHPEQNRALSLREGAILQSFPMDYQFVAPEGGYCFKTIGRMIGNAVPVVLGRVIGETIKRHILKQGGIYE